MDEAVIKTELLAPAKDLDCGIAAINSGADAVYIGAARFGARSKVGNSLADIAALVEHAHTYWARVYVTVNTLLYDQELPQAVRLIHKLHDIDVDGVIIQDVGLLEREDLPPIPLIASTQMHNHTPEKVAFLEAIGFRRVILARELSLAQIRAIRQAAPRVELESFVHGALCVSYSGQCYMSYAVGRASGKATGGRSGNRGECAQPCRRLYTLVDREGTPVVKDKHLLSLRDLNLSAHLDELLDAGISSFKIEGRLKDVAYIKNVVSFYRQHLDAVLARRAETRSSSGHSEGAFTPDVDKTFNRGYTSYFLHERTDPPGNIETPKMVGELVGKVATVKGKRFTLESGALELHNGDGICFFERNGNLQGTVINNADGRTVTPDKIAGIRKGVRIYRNHDHAFLNQVRKAVVTRKISVSLTFADVADGFALTATDEDGNVATEHLSIEKTLANKPEKAQATIEKQLRKMGNTSFVCSALTLMLSAAYFVPLSALNGLRRDVLARLALVRAENRPTEQVRILKNDVAYPQTTLTFKGNALNAGAVAFYQRHGVTEVAPAAESGLDLRGQPVMRTKYCIKHQLGWCDGAPHRGGHHKSQKFKEPLYLVDEDGHRYKLRFDCAACEMEVYF